MDYNGYIEISRIWSISLPLMTWINIFSFLALCTVQIDLTYIQIILAFKGLQKQFRTMLEASNNLNNIQLVLVYNVNHSEHIMKIFLTCSLKLF